MKLPYICGDYVLDQHDSRLQLLSQKDSKTKPFCVDFLSGTLTYRRKKGGGRGQAIARAVGLKKGKCPTVLDATAGLARDAFVLASLGCRIHMIERCEAVYALVKDALRRAVCDDTIGDWIKERMSLEWSNSLEGFSNLPFAPDVVYLDPMFPEKLKSASVKKEMNILKDILGADEDAEGLLSQAFKVATQRIVVKRSAQAPFLNGKKPDAQVKTPKNRFDIYLISHRPSAIRLPE